MGGGWAAWQAFAPTSPPPPPPEGGRGVAYVHAGERGYRWLAPSLSLYVYVCHGRSGWGERRARLRRTMGCGRADRAVCGSRRAAAVLCGAQASTSVGSIYMHGSICVAQQRAAGPEAGARRVGEALCARWLSRGRAGCPSRGERVCIRMCMCTATCKNTQKTQTTAVQRDPTLVATPKIMTLRVCGDF